MPSTAEIASGTETETCSAPAWTFSAAPESPSQESSSDSRSCWTVSGSSWRKSRTPPTSGTSRSRKSRRTASAVPSTVTVAASPRDRRVFAITKRTGYSKTSARKMPTKTIRNVLPIAMKAAKTATVAPMSNTVRIGRRSSIRRVPTGSTADNLRRRAVDSCLCPTRAQRGTQTETLIGEVATQISPTKKITQPRTRSATRARSRRSFVLIPAKKRAEANMTTART